MHGTAHGTASGTTEVLFVELLGGFGDLLLALPAVHAVARSVPGARVTVATFDPGGELLAADPLVTAVRTTADHAEGAPARFVAGLLDEHRYDLAVTTTAYGGIPDLLRGRVPRVADRLWQRPPPDELVDERFLRLLAAEGLVRPELVGFAPRVALRPAEVAAGAALLGGGTPVLLLPDAGMPVKRWPGWAGLVRALRDGAGSAVDGSDVDGSDVDGSDVDGWDVDGLDVAVVPGPGDDAAARASGARLLPGLTLRGLAGLAAAVGQRGGVVVGADTGPVRLAAASGARTVGLFGPTLASRYGQRPQDGHVGLQGLPGCRVRLPNAITEQECWWTARCPLTGADPACMADLPVADVVRAVRAAVAGRLAA